MIELIKFNQVSPDYYFGREISDAYRVLNKPKHPQHPIFWIFIFSISFFFSPLRDSYIMSNEDNKENLLSLHLHHFARKNRPLSPFISKLRFLLNCTKHQDAIHWSSDGRSIVITNVEVFKQSVLDNDAEMFKTKNFTSFVRQLNLYGFRKVTATCFNVSNM